MITRKIDNSTLELTKVIPKKTEKILYDFEFLVRQKEMLEADLARIIEQHASEIKLAKDNVEEVSNLLAEFAKLRIDGVKPKLRAELKKV
jgi:hypothetical protein